MLILRLAKATAERVTSGNGQPAYVSALSADLEEKDGYITCRSEDDVLQVLTAQERDTAWTIFAGPSLSAENGPPLIFPMSSALDEALRENHPQAWWLMLYIIDDYIDTIS